MPLKTGNEFVESLRNLNLEVYIFGKREENTVDHPMVVPSMNSVKITYDLAHDPAYEDLMTAKSHITGNKINRFTHIHQSADDLVKKIKMQRLLGQKTASCFQRCVGMDALNAVYSTTFDMDNKLGTGYFDKLKEFLVYVQDNDLTVDGAMTDPKGDRSCAPSKQEDPDLFLRVVEKREDGIVVRGAKAHQTGIVNSHEILVMPTMSMKEDDKDYAVCFAVPTDTKGIKIIYGRQASDTRKLEGGEIDTGNPKFGGHEALVVFEDVFVPNNRVFMCGEYAFSGTLVERFAGFHRQSYGGCKVGVGDVLIGAASLMSDYNGAAAASHVKDKIIEMIHLNETLYSCGIACSAEGRPTAAGSYEIDMLLANVCKQNVTRFPYEIARLAEDISGGIFVTMPSEQDLNSPEVGAYIRKYYAGAKGVPVEHRIKVARLVENMTLGAAAVGYRTESMHGAGSPQAQRIMISRQSDLEAKKNLVKELLDIE
ncbi:MAG: 4-hydroxyphenylacetate 3-hydroxylase family protein [Defluviitaleaceae bacterium]|nr:4-hydroxyphenylacetate 3-hydroxylase family protein [Defluviitaleaceae bacterium]